METSRRGFLGILGSIPLALKVNWQKVEEKKKTLLTPNDLTEGIPIRPGWHSVKVTDVWVQESKLDGSPVYGITMRNADGEEIKSRFSSKYLQSMVPCLTAMKVLQTESVDLEEAIGKEMRVRVEKEFYRDKHYNTVTEYIALER